MERVKWGVKLLNYNGNHWCNWSPFSNSQRWSYDINVAYKLLENLLKSWRGEAIVEEYVEYKGV